MRYKNRKRRQEIIASTDPHIGRRPLSEARPPCLQGSVGAEAVHNELTVLGQSMTIPVTNYTNKMIGRAGQTGERSHPEETNHGVQNNAEACRETTGQSTIDAEDILQRLVQEQPEQRYQPTIVFSRGVAGPDSCTISRDGIMIKGEDLNKWEAHETAEF